MHCGSFEKIFLKCLQIKIQNSNTKQEVINLIYQLRYYNLLPFNQNLDIGKLESISEEIKIVKRELIKKAHEVKVIDRFSKNHEIDYYLLEIIFNIRVISLEDLYIKIIKEKEKYYIQLFDEDMFEEKIEIENMENLDKKDLEIKLNKKIKIFN